MKHIERLKWHNYSWSAISLRADGTRMMVYGMTHLDDLPTRDELHTCVLNSAAALSTEAEICWDPFNVSLLIRARLGTT